MLTSFSIGGVFFFCSQEGKKAVSVLALGGIQTLARGASCLSEEGVSISRRPQIEAPGGLSKTERSLLYREIRHGGTQRSLAVSSRRLARTRKVFHLNKKRARSSSDVGEKKGLIRAPKGGRGRKRVSDTSGRERILIFPREGKGVHRATS